jgi:hypothetical protein
VLELAHFSYPVDFLQRSTFTLVTPNSYFAVPLHNEKLHNLYSLPNIIRMIQVKEDEMDRACSLHGGEEECIQGFGGNARREETSRKTRHRWEDNIK